MKLEIKGQEDKTYVATNAVGGMVMVTPPISESYWLYRVKLHKDQAIIGFPKFFTIGIGFALEEDWNTNLPYTSTAKSICDHIWHNRKYQEITPEQVIEAIELIQAEVKAREVSK